MPELIIVIIFLLLGWDAAAFWFTKDRTSKLENIIYPTTDRVSGIQARLSISGEECKELIRWSKKATFWYSMYSNSAAAFTLLGILGTVASLMQMSGMDNLADNFMSALNTTFWGLIFAIASKIADPFISASLERAVDEADYLIHEHDSGKKGSECGEDESGI